MAAESAEEYKQMFGVRLQVPCDMPDDVLRFVISLARKKLGKIGDWQAEGDGVVESMKDSLDKTYGATWHVVVGKHFGSKVTHEAKMFCFFYCGDRAVLVFKLTAF